MVSGKTDYTPADAGFLLVRHCLYVSISKLLLNISKRLVGSFDEEEDMPDARFDENAFNIVSN